MPEKIFTYPDPKFLNKLAVSVNRERCELSVGLHPDIPEFIEAVNKPGNYKNWDIHLLHLRALCETHHIMPFRSLVFRYDCEPQINYMHTGHLDDEVLRRLINSGRHPAYFAMNMKWFSITFDSLVGEEAGKAQAAISEFAKNGYVVTRVEANLDPYIRSADHYCDVKESRATLWGMNGRVSISGDFPDDLDIQDLVPKELPAPGIPPVGIEELLKA